MKKHIKILSFFICFLIIPNTYSQIVKGAFIIGGNISQVDGDEVVGYNKLGLVIGTAGIAPLGKHFSLLLETIYNQKGANQKGDKYKINDNGAYNLILNYVEVPLLLSYEDKETINFSTGLSWGRLISVKEYEHDIHIPTTTLINGPYNRSEFCWIADIRFRLYNRWKLNFRYSYSINKIRSRYFPKINETRAQFNNIISLRLVYIIEESGDE